MSAAVRDNSTNMHFALQDYLSRQTETKLLEIFIPVFSFIEEENKTVGQLLADSQMNHMMPLYEYLGQTVQEATQVEDRMTIDMILLAEANEEYDNLPDNPERDEIGEDDPRSIDDLANLLEAENELAANTQQTNMQPFVPRSKQLEIDINSLLDYETLVKNFYTIDRNTMIGNDQLNANRFQNVDLTISKETENPQILIYHTHSQEAFADSVPGDASTTIVGVGDYLTKVLVEQYGYNVMHHNGQYDVQSRDDAYSKALPEIEKILADNPSIQVVIDLHRDAMAEETHLVMDLDGRPTAQFMFFNGLSRTKKTGNISYLYNENLEKNLAFSFQMQHKAVQYYPGLTRKIYLKGYRYNMHLRPRTLLVELGAQNNTLEEVMNACNPLAHILDMVLSGE